MRSEHNRHLLTSSPKSLSLGDGVVSSHTMFDAGLTDLIATHGYWFVATVIALESMGLPLPGETVLVTAGLYAGTTHELDIAVLVAAAAIGATLGDNVGFWVGRRF